jgi:hypothetical protein
MKERTPIRTAPYEYEKAKAHMAKVSEARQEIDLVMRYSNLIEQEGKHGAIIIHGPESKTIWQK